MEDVKVFLTVDDTDIQHLGIMYLAKILKINNFDVEIVRALPEELLRKIPTDKKVILGYSTLTAFYQYFLLLNQVIKKHRNVFSVFGGPHATFYPDMINDEGVDGICIGEGEYALLDLVTKYSRGEDITQIENWYIKKDGKIYKNPVRPLIKDLDTIPFPDRTLFKKSLSSLMSSRGCPYKCSYCFNHAYNKLYDNKNIIRKRSVANLIEELKEIKAESNPDIVKFEDDIFIMSKEWLREFSWVYKKEIGLPFICYVRANLVDQEVVDLLKDAGCHSIAMGIEAGNDKIRNDVLLRNMKKEDMINAAGMFREAGIKIRTYNILGIAGTNLDEDFETLELNRQCKPDHASSFLMVPYPGTKINTYSKEKGMFDDDYSDVIEVNKKIQIKVNDRKYIRQVQNLHKLFPLAVEFTPVFRMLRFLIKLPNNSLFDMLHALWNRYCYNYRIIPSRKNRARQIKRMFRVSFDKYTQKIDNLKKMLADSRS